MAKSLFSAIAAMALAMFAPTAAHAVTIYQNYNFDFSNSYIVSSSSGVGNSMVFRSTTDPLLKVKVTAWSIDRINDGSSITDDIVTAATLKLWDGGLGVQNKYETDTSPNHSIDNGLDSSGSKYMVDFVMLQFDYDVDINTMTTGWVSGDSDASLRVGPGPLANPANWANTPALDGKKVHGSTSAVELNDYVTMINSAASMNPTVDNAATGSRNVNANNQHGMMWILGALYGTQNNDYFKLDALNIKVFPTIPEPSTWMTMILGFGLVGWSMRRRKAPAKGTRALA